jgi:hypothetical protein
VIWSLTSGSEHVLPPTQTFETTLNKFESGLQLAGRQKQNRKTMNDKIPQFEPTLEKLAFTKAELCAVLGISPVTVWRLEKRGLLRSIGGLRHKLFSKTEVNRFLKTTAPA